MRVVGRITNKEGEKKKHCLPLELRIQLYNEVVELRKQGLSQRKIQKRIYEKHGKRISLSVISCWIRGKKHPLGKVNKFIAKPLPELSYVIGTILGDSYKCFDKNNRSYFLRLAVNDKEFAEEFSKNLTKVLGRKKPYKPFWDRNLKQWVAQGYSFLLYKFLEEKSFEELKVFIEHCKDCVASFLKALFDSEGSISPQKHRWDLRLYNTDRELLIYTKYLLEKYFEIYSTGPHLARKAGKIMHFPNGKIAKSNEDYYYIYIRAKSLQNFYKFIGFSIKRKQQRLLKAIK